MSMSNKLNLCLAVNSSNILYQNTLVTINTSQWFAKILLFNVLKLYNKFSYFLNILPHVFLLKKEVVTYTNIKLVRHTKNKNESNVELLNK